jgi:hypothetical protein
MESLEPKINNNLGSGEKVYFIETIRIYSYLLVFYHSQIIGFPEQLFNTKRDKTKIQHTTSYSFYFIFEKN